MASAGLTEDATILRQLVSGMLSLQDSRYTSAAAVTVWVYDIFLTLDIEVDFIWSDFQFTIPNALYILNRYGCLGFFLVTIYDLAGYRSDQSESYCRKGLQVVGFVIGHLCWTIIMTLRVTALWSQNKMLVRTIWVLWACTICAITIMASMAHIQVSGGIVYDPTIRMCVPTTTLPPVMTTSPIAPALYELLLTVLTIVKIYNHGSIVGDSYISPLMRTLTRDGVIYFLMSNALAIANLLCWNLLPPSHSLILLYLYWGVVATLISRLVLNLRIISHRRSLLGETTDTVTFDPRLTFGHGRARELPTLARIQTNISDIDLDFINSRAHNKRSTLQHDTGDDQSWRLSHGPTEDHRPSLLNDAVVLPALPRDGKSTSFVKFDELQQWKGGTNYGNFTSERTGSNIQGPTQIAVPLRTLSTSNG